MPGVPGKTQFVAVVREVGKVTAGPFEDTGHLVLLELLFHPIDQEPSGAGKQRLVPPVLQCRTGLLHLGHQVPEGCCPGEPHSPWP